MKIPFWFLLLLLLMSCNNSLDLDIPFEGPKLVAACLLAPQEDLVVTLTQTKPPTGPDTGVWVVTNALVIFHQTGGFADTLRYDADVEAYLPDSAWQPTAGVSYWLEATAPGFQRIYSDTVLMPTPLPIDNWTFQDSSRTGINSNQAIGDIYLTFSATSNSQNYFYLVGNSYRDGERINVLKGCLGGDVATSCVINPDGAEPECIFPQSCILQTPTTLGYWITTSNIKSFSRPIPPPSRFDSIVVQLRTVHPDLYQYYQTRYQPYEFELAFSEPGSVHSNMHCGYGLLGAYSESRVVIPLR